MYSVYILYSTSGLKYYIGQTNNINDRPRRHNAGESQYTKGVIPWKIIYSIKLETASEDIFCSHFREIFISSKSSAIRLKN
ncbi:MAG: GIY-YIG nuclease family protein [Pedobacter sp.]|nr:MAG: GIY-YIG nuclease family protein [Pedobacter sp.]